MSVCVCADIHAGPCLADVVTVPVQLTYDEITALLACLGDPRIWGEPESTYIASVVVKLVSAEVK